MKRKREQGLRVFINYALEKRDPWQGVRNGRKALDLCIPHISPASKI